MAVGQFISFSPCSSVNSRTTFKCIRANLIRNDKTSRLWIRIAQIVHRSCIVCCSSLRRGETAVWRTGRRKQATMTTTTTNAVSGWRVSDAGCRCAAGDAFVFRRCPARRRHWPPSRLAVSGDSAMWWRRLNGAGLGGTGRIALSDARQRRQRYHGTACRLQFESTDATCRLSYCSWWYRHVTSI